MTVFVGADSGLVVPPHRPQREASSGRRLPLAAIAELNELTELYEATIADLRAHIQDPGWTRLDDQNGQQFSRDDIGKVIAAARAAYLKNPLINRSVEIGALYVWGQDLSINAPDPTVKAVVDRFWRDNRGTLTGQQASHLLEVELQVTANVFCVLFPDPSEGRVQVRTAPVEEITGIISNPEDRSEVWYYARQWREQPIGGGQAETRTAYYPDIDHKPESKPESVQVNGNPVEIRWGTPIKHIKVGAFPHWRWGVPEVYPALDWAKAYKQLLEDDATRSRALARYAWRITTEGGRGAVDAAKTRLHSTLGGGSNTETNPPSAAGSAFVGDKSVGLDPIRIAGSTLDPDHSRPIRLMASAGLGLPDHFFDADVGNYATSSTLDRPTELRYSDRRELWIDELGDLIDYAIDADVAATSGLLRGSVDEKQRKVELSFPDLLERDVPALVTAIAAAAPHLPAELVARLMMQALGVDDIDGELTKMQSPSPEPPAPPQTEANAPPALARIAEAGDDGTITLSDIAAITAWWDKTVPQYAGLLNATIVTEDEDA